MQGPTSWPALTVIDDELLAVLDNVAIVAGYGVTISALGNDVGVGRSISAVSLQDPLLGGVSTNGTTVTFIPSNTAFVSLMPGEFTTLTINYTITNGSAFDSDHIVIRVERHMHIWIDQDASPILDEDGAFLNLWVDQFEFWLDQDGLLIMDEDAALIQMSEVIT